MVDEGAREMRGQEPVRIPKNVLEELESVRRYTRAKVLDIPTLRFVTMETSKPALVLWSHFVSLILRPATVEQSPAVLLRVLVYPQDPKEVSRDIARDLSSLVGELNAMRADAIHWLEGPEYGPLRLRQR